MKNIGKFLPAFLVVFLLAGCGPSSGGDTPTISFEEVKELDVYSPDAENGLAPTVSGKIRCGFSSYYGNEEAYYCLDDVLGEVSKTVGMAEDFESTSSGDVVSYRGGKTYEVSFSVDAGENLISFSDYPSYIGLRSGTEGDFAWTTGINRVSYIDGGTQYVGGGETVFDLGAYHIDVVLHDGDIYLPSAIARYVFLDVQGISLLYNGNAVYRPSSHDDIYSGGLTAFGEAYYDSPFLSLETKGENAAKLQGDETMFYFDHFYGFPDDEKYEGGTLSSYLEKNYPEEYALFYSRNKEDGERVYEWFLHAYLDDLHSTAPANMGSLYAGYEFENIYGSTPRYMAYIERYLELFLLRQEALGIEGNAGSGSVEEMLSIEGDMAVIRFDAFQWNSTIPTTGDSSYYAEHAYEDVYSLFAYSFLELEGKGIKKVVIDLTINGGGYSEACFEGLSFLSDVVNSSFYYTIDGSSYSTSFQGILPGERTESYAEQYDIYLMTSACTFSSANLMAHVGKSLGIKTIGEKSGGGACMVGFFYTPEGQAARISSPIRLPETTGKAHIEGGIAPDIELDSSYFYDLPKLSAKLDEVSAS